MQFNNAIEKAKEALRTRSVLVAPGRWQSIDVSTKPELATYEVLNYSLAVPINGTGADLNRLRQDIQPNLPWADDHFLERVGGQPLNPGEQWRNWPYAHSADKFRTESGKRFSHTYMERYWPKGTEDGELSRVGIRYAYGDLNDVVDHLVKDPLSRQAYLPIFFPEDTGKIDVRVPCTLGYHFIMRHGFFHCTYYIRSCDFMRHFRDDIYLTVRLQLWMLDRLRERDKNWFNVGPGLFTMHIVSLHLFRNDFRKIYGYEPVEKGK